MSDLLEELRTEDKRAKGPILIPESVILRESGGQSTQVVVNVHQPKQDLFNSSGRVTDDMAERRFGILFTLSFDRSWRIDSLDVIK